MTFTELKKNKIKSPVLLLLSEPEFSKKANSNVFFTNLSITVNSKHFVLRRQPWFFYNY